MNPYAGANTDETGATWIEIERQLDATARRAQAETAISQFYPAFLNDCMQALAAVAGAIWLPRDGGAERAFRICGEATPTADLAKRVGGVLQSRQPQIASPRPDAIADADSSTCGACLLSPVVCDDRAVAVVEVHPPAGVSPAALQNYQRVLSAFCELAGDFHRRQELRELRGRIQARAAFDELVRNVHQSLDPGRTAYALANDGRRAIGCDRVTVLLAHGSGYRTVAISGVDQPDRRAAAVRALERLAAAAAPLQESLWYGGVPLDLPPQIDAALQSYLDASAARQLAIVPLLDKATAPADRGCRPFAIVIAEAFDVRDEEPVFRDRVLQVCEPGACALRNALTYARVPFLPAWRIFDQALGRFRGRRLPGALLALAGAGLIVAALVWVPAELRIEAHGELQPETRRIVFAPADGVIETVLVDHGDEVQRGDLVLEMRRSPLDFEFSRVIGERQTAQKQYDAIRARRREESQRTASPEERNQLAAEEERLKEAIAGLDAQAEILRKQREELRVRSPIAGTVLTWSVAENLEHRPVQRGQALLTIADTAGPWVLELKVPDRAIGHVLAAQRDLRSALDVSFLLATDPAITYRGTIADVARAAQATEGSEATVRVTVAFDRALLRELRPGAQVAASIACGRRALGYAWFHELIDAVRTKFAF